MISKAM